MLRIIHIITTLDHGGAEAMLYKLLCSIDKRSYNIKVICMRDKGYYGNLIQDQGIEVFALNITLFSAFSALLKAIKICANADIIHTWMYHADLLGFLVSKLSATKKLIWSIRHSDFVNDKKSTFIIAKTNSVLSRWVDCVLVNSKRGRNIHIDIGYCNDNMLVIPNGFDLQKFRYIPNARSKLIADLGTGACPLVGFVARWHKMKGHEVLFKAVQSLVRRGFQFKLVLCGEGIHPSNVEINELLDQFQLYPNVRLLGCRNDIVEIISAMDVFVLASVSGEGFPNVIGEAMACEIPCVVTDVGDSASIVGDTGIVVKPGDSSALAEGLLKMLSLTYEQRREIGERARMRITSLFDIEKIVKQIERMYEL